MENREYYKEYFEKFSGEWIADAYETDGYNYPVGKNRLRILNNILRKYDIRGKKALDIGCGGGDISFLLAGHGADVTGIDMSDSMLETAESRKEKMLGADCSGSVQFRHEMLPEISQEILSQKYDVIVAFGLIGYLENDRVLFDLVDQISHPGTLFLVSCRNELFNMTSISDNTVEEIHNGNAVRLIHEIDRLYDQTLDIDAVEKFAENLDRAVQRIKEPGLNNMSDQGTQKTKTPQEGTGSRMARQSTPEDLKRVATEYSFALQQFYGVHPHLLLPRLNRKLPAEMFNTLSEALTAFEDQDISLIWSSVFIAELVRK